MRFKFSNRAPKLEKVPSRDASRPVLTCWYLDTESGTIAATDSYKLVRHSVQVEPDDVSGLIPGEAMAAYVKVWNASKGLQPSLNCLEGIVTLTDSNGSQSIYKRPEGTFPTVANLIPTELSSFVIGLNAKLLLECAQGLGAGNDVVEVRFTLQGDKSEGSGVGSFPNNLRPFVISSKDQPNADCVLMPVRVSS